MENSTILVINCGSSSLKFALVQPAKEVTLLEGIAENLNGDHPVISWQTHSTKQSETLADASYQTALAAIENILQKTNQYKINAVGHRVVHGGEAFKQSCLINPKVLATIEQCIPLAPLHNPANLSGIAAAQTLFPTVAHVAVFDTAFHQTMQSHAYIYPLPYELYQQYGVRRYGFHGTSHQYVTQQAAKQLNLNYRQSAFISAHLGNGCSAAAVLNGQSIDTSMGLTPLEGLVMGTRCGDIDPSLHHYIAERLQIDLSQVNDMLNRQSGLLGMSGLSFDMRVLSKAAEEGNQQAQLAIDVFCYRLAKYIGALAVALGRLDALIFTGGIGENSALVRAKVIDRLSILNLELDEAANQQHGQQKHGIISTESSNTAMVVNTDEQLAIAQEVVELLTH